MCSDAIESIWPHSRMRCLEEAGQRPTFCLGPLISMPAKFVGWRRHRHHQMQFVEGAAFAGVHRMLFPPLSGPSVNSRLTHRNWRERRSGVSKATRRDRHDALPGWAGTVKWKVAPWGALEVTHKRPACASMIERQIDSPIPRPPGFVV